MRRSEADLELFETSIRAVLASTLGWAGRSEVTIQPIAKLHQRVKAYADGLRLDMTALLNEQHARGEPFQVALFGRTKSGKSTLYGALSREPGAGMHIGRGGDRTTKDIRRYPAAGILFVDVPGICAYGQEGRLDEEIAKTVIEPSDVILFVVTDDGVQDKELEALYQLRLYNKPLILVHNVKLGLGDSFTLQRARDGKERIFDEATLGEHRRRIDRYFRERGIEGPDRVIPIHADAAWRSVVDSDTSLCAWFRSFSRIADLEAALVECADARGAFIRGRTYSEPLIRFHADTVEQLRRDSIALRLHRRFVAEQKDQLVRLMRRLEQDCIAKLDALGATFAPLEAQIDALLDAHTGERLLAEWTAVLNGAAAHMAIESLAGMIASDVNAALSEFQRESEYDAEAVARDIEVECSANMPTLGAAGRWWRRGGMALAAVGGVATLLTGGAAGVAIAALSAIGGYFLKRVGDNVERERRREFEASRDVARAMMLESLRAKEAAVRRSLERWLRRHLGEAARRRATREFEDLIRGIDGIRDAMDTCGRALASTLDEENRRLLNAAFRTANGRDAPTILRVARAQGALVKAFCSGHPPREAQEATSLLLGERVQMLQAPDGGNLADDVAMALHPARAVRSQVRIRDAEGDGGWPSAFVRLPDDERGRAIGAKGVNVKVAGELCRARIRVERARRQA